MTSAEKDWKNQVDGRSYFWTKNQTFSSAISVIIQCVQEQNDGVSGKEVMHVFTSWTSFTKATLDTAIAECSVSQELR